MARPSLTSVFVNSSPVARRVLLHLYAIGSGEHTTTTQHDAFAKPGAAVIWIRKGRGLLKIGPRQWNLEHGPCFWVFGTDQTRFVVPDAGQSIITCAFWFSGPGLENWLEELQIKHNSQFCLPHPERIYLAYRTMFRLVRRQPLNWELKIHLQLAALMGEFLIARNVLAPAPSTLPTAITRVLNAIESDPARDWGIGELAGIAQMSHSAFRGLFRKTMNELPHTHLQRVRMRLAREMLADPRMLLKEIAGKLHFSSENYFSHFFRQHSGISPMEFRQLALKSRATTPGPDKR